MLIQLTDRVYVLPGGVNIGLVRVDETQCILIDAGLNDTPARKAIRAAREQLDSGIVAILTTHGHADHFGGNATIVKRTGAQVWAPAIDEAVLRYPILQPALLYGGADPIDAMRNGFMLAEASPVDVIYDAGTLHVAGLALEAISLAGHSPNQMGILVDAVFFAADVMLPETVLEKYRIPYLYSVTDHLISLARCSEVVCSSVVPGHGPVLVEVDGLRDRNLAIVEQTAAIILDYCSQLRTSSAVMTHVLNKSEAYVSDAPGFYLLQPTIHAYLSHLTRTGELAHLVAANRSLWQRA